jgi:hypothetical protein
MPKIANLKSYPFELKQSFDDIKKENIVKSLEGKLDFYEIKNTTEMFFCLQNVFGEKSHMDITNCKFDGEYLYQSFSVDKDNENLHGNLVIIKRKIKEDDTYTFLGFNPNVPETDIYEFVDMTTDDIVEIVKNKSQLPALIIKDNGEIIKENLLYLNRNDDVGKILLESNNKEILYLNIANIVNGQKNLENENIIESIIKEKSSAYGANYCFTQISIGLSLFNCFYHSFAENKNETMSNLLQHDIYGDSIIFLQNNSDNDTDTIINLNKELFEKIFDIVVNNKRLKRKNPHFFNIYKELC